MLKGLGWPKPRARGRRRWWALVKETWAEFQADDVSRMGAALAYYTVFSVAPIFVMAVAVAGAVFGEEAATGKLYSQLEGLLGDTAAAAVQSIVQDADRAGGGAVATVVGVVTLLLGASSVFVQLRGALNRMWGVVPRKAATLWATVRARLMSIALVFAMGFLLMVSLVASAVIAGLETWLSGLLPFPPFLLELVNQLVSLGVLTLLFAVIYKYLPDTKIDWSDVWAGSVATAALFTIGKFAIGQYLGRSSIASSYGAAGSLVVLLVWVYYSAQLVLLGAEFTQVYARSRGSHRLTRPLRNLLGMAEVPGKPRK